MPNSVAFDVPSIPEGQADFYEIQGKLFEQVAVAQGGPALPDECRSRAQYVLIGYWAWHTHVIKSEVN